MVIIKSIFIIFILSIITFNQANAAIIYDYETENFIQKLIDKVKIANSLSKEIKFRIFKSDQINAFVNENNTIYISSGLIENSDDYVALLSVIAHEIGHIHKKHIAQRKTSIKKINNFKSISNLSIVAASIISGNSDFMQSLVISEASLKDFFLNFSKDQEREADIYSIETISKLKLPVDSILQLLKNIEDNLYKKGITKEQQLKSTHPLFSERIDIINYKIDNSESKLDIKTNREFLYIKAKFLGYSKQMYLLNNLDNNYKKYAKSIASANDGELKISLKNLNYLIRNEINNVHFFETKADILLSHGYKEEAVEFYRKVTAELPKNDYARVKLLVNVDIKKLKYEEKMLFFDDNIDLLYKYYFNKKILNVYLILSEELNLSDWNNFLNFWVNNVDKGKDSLKSYVNKNQININNNIKLNIFLSKIQKHYL